METEPGEQVFFSGHPCWRALLGHYVRALLASLLAGVIAGVVTRITGHHVSVGWVVVAVIVVFVVLALVAQLRRIQTTYAITDQRLTIETGLLTKQIHQTRLERIQNVNSEQSFGERLLRIGTVAFDTAAEADFDFSFQGVANPRGIVRTVDRALHELRGDRGAAASDG